MIPAMGRVKTDVHCQNTVSFGLELILFYLCVKAAAVDRLCFESPRLTRDN